MHRRTDYHYDLPAELIAQAPADRRDQSRLLVVGPAGNVDADGLADRGFPDIVELLPRDAVLVINDTRVFPARLRTTKPTGGAVELLFLEPVAPPGTTGSAESWRCMARSSKPLRPGTRLTLAAAPEHTLTVRSDRADDSTIIVEVSAAGNGNPALALLETYGEVPLPPYIARPQGSSGADAERYQTVYAREPGAVAAPTAGLHFTPDILAALQARGVVLAPITLHVGMGTFAPVRALNLDEHRMHVERFAIPPASAAILEQALEQGKPICAVGTTCVRALESAALCAGADPTGKVTVAPGPATTDLFIRPGGPGRPGFEFRVVDHLITNFHLPESTLLMLVCAFAGHERVMSAYRHAVAAGYRFFSYGDAMLLRRPPRS
jgi:S-adenosylmethionine:tRNA ribosyltransferase-isomerase